MSSKSTVRTRFSPSPTGMIHLGNARAALFSALYAKKHDGVFVLRIEDTDAVRSEERFSDMLQTDLHWLGVYWQEGPGTNGPYGPYWQSQRQAIYAKYYEQLEATHLIYPCFCSDQELNLARKRQMAKGHAPRYSGTCRKLSDEAIQQKLAEGKKPAWRFKVPIGETISFEDMVKGTQSFKSDDIGDFIVRRADGTAPFLFCNAIDDSEMHISHVIRGDDHVANTPRQLMILSALSLPHPRYGHLSMIVGDDGAPLSKRHGSFSLGEMIHQGYLPSALMNYLSRLGHTCEAQTLLTFDELAAEFSSERLGKSPARFDVAQLKYWQKLAVMSLDNQTIWRWLGESVANRVPAKEQDLFAETVRSNVEFPQDALEWANIFFHDKVDLEEPERRVICEAGEQYFVEAEQAVDKHHLDLKPALDEMKQTLGVSGKKLFMPFRVALTGKTHGPELANIVGILGEKKVKHRLGNAFKLASNKG